MVVNHMVQPIDGRHLVPLALKGYGKLRGKGVRRGRRGSVERGRRG
jgi:hypothetical protein